MSDYIPEEKTTAFPCPVCEVRESERKWARKVDNYFVCNICGTRYRSRDEANRRRELATANS